MERSLLSHLLISLTLDMATKATSKIDNLIIAKVKVADGSDIVSQINRLSFNSFN